MLAALIILTALPQSNECEDEPHIEEASGGAPKRDIHVPDQPLVVRGMPSLPKTLHAHVSDLHVCWGVTTRMMPPSTGQAFHVSFWAWFAKIHTDTQSSC